MDSLTFSVILHEECLLNDYNIVTPAQQQKKANRTSSLINAFGRVMSQSGSQVNDGGFPMAFESDHVPVIVQSF